MTVVFCPEAGCEFSRAKAVTINGGLQERDLDRHVTGECHFRYVACDYGCGETKLRARDEPAHKAVVCPCRPTPCPLHCGDVPLTIVDKHVKTTCPNRTVQCALTDCGASMLACEVTAHQNVECPLHCENAELCGGNLDCHLSEHCPNRPVPCTLECAEQVPLSSMGQHCATECAHRPVLCTLECGVTLRQCDLAHHMKEVCPNRMIECTQCEQQFKDKNLATHLVDGCPLRIVPCPKGCGDIVFNTTEAHVVNECPRRSVPCSIGCGDENVTFETFETHVTQKCPLRSVSCPHGCNASVPVYDLSHHTEARCPGVYHSQPHMGTEQQDLTSLWSVEEAQISDVLHRAINMSVLDPLETQGTSFEAQEK